MAFYSTSFNASLQDAMVPQNVFTGFYPFFELVPALSTSVPALVSLEIWSRLTAATGVWLGLGNPAATGVLPVAAPEKFVSHNWDKSIVPDIAINKSWSSAAPTAPTTYFRRAKINTLSAQPGIIVRWRWPNGLSFSRSKTLALVMISSDGSYSPSGFVGLAINATVAI